MHTLFDADADGLVSAADLATVLGLARPFFGTSHTALQQRFTNTLATAGGANGWRFTAGLQRWMVPEAVHYTRQGLLLAPFQRNLSTLEGCLPVVSCITDKTDTCLPAVSRMQQLKLSCTGDQGLTLVHLSPQPKPSWSTTQRVRLSIRLGENHAPNVSHKMCLR